MVFIASDRQLEYKIGEYEGMEQMIMENFQDRKCSLGQTEKMLTGNIFSEKAKKLHENAMRTQFGADYWLMAYSSIYSV